MRNLFKGKIVTSLVVLSTLILAGIAVFTALRLYQLNTKPVAPNAPTQPKASTSNTQSCKALTFSINQPTATPVPSTTSTPTSAPSSTPGATSTPGPTATNGPTPTLGSPEAPVCTATKPGTPTITSVKMTGTTATVTWTKVSLATHYSISYGTQSGKYDYGVPNTGDVTSYTVQNLDANQKYYFVVNAVNDCMPGNQSVVVSSVASASTSASLPNAGVALPTILTAVTGAVILLLGALIFVI